MKFNFYHSTCNAVLALVSLFAFGLSYGQSKTVQSGYQVITVGDTEVIALSDSTVAVSANELLTAKKPGSKAQDAFVWVPAPYSMLGRNQ